MDKVPVTAATLSFALKKVMDKLRKFTGRWRRLAGALLVALGVACMVAGCTRRVYVPVERSVRDSVFDSRLRTDTLWVRDSIREAVRGDTVEREVYRLRWRVRTRVDTVYRTLRDTVRVTLQPESHEASAGSGSWLSHGAHLLKWVTRVLFVVILVGLLIRYRR